jgi:hypothetical protein
VLDLHLAKQSVNRAFQFHLTNLGLHIVNCVLLFLLLRRLGVRLEICMLCAGVFALHPIQVAGIASVARRGILLGTFFSLLMMLAYLRYVVSLRQSLRALVLLMYAAAFYSEPVFMVLPLVLMLLDVWPLRRVRKGVVREKWPLLMMAVLWSVIALLRVKWGGVQFGVEQVKDEPAKPPSINIRT